MTPAQKKKLNEALLFTVDEQIHQASYEPGKYLKEDL